MKHIIILIVLFNSLSFANDDLPVEIQGDLLLTEAKKHMDEGNWKSAVLSFEKLMA